MKENIKEELIAEIDKRVLEVSKKQETIANDTFSSGACNDYLKKLKSCRDWVNEGSIFTMLDLEKCLNHCKENFDLIDVVEPWKENRLPKLK